MSEFSDAIKAPTTHDSSLKSIQIAILDDAFEIIESAILSTFDRRGLHIVRVSIDDFNNVTRNPVLSTIRAKQSNGATRCLSLSDCDLILIDTRYSARDEEGKTEYVIERFDKFRQQRTEHQRSIIDSRYYVMFNEEDMNKALNARDPLSQTYVAELRKLNTYIKNKHNDHIVFCDNNPGDPKNHKINQIIGLIEETAKKRGVELIPKRKFSEADLNTTFQLWIQMFESVIRRLKKIGSEDLSEIINEFEKLIEPYKAEDGKNKQYERKFILDFLSNNFFGNEKYHLSDISSILEGHEDWDLVSLFHDINGTLEYLGNRFENERNAQSDQR